jgi:protein phosphatase
MVPLKSPSIVVAQAADQGQQRDSMQDSVDVRMLDAETALLVVADGMGGAPAGDVASGRALAAVIDTLGQRDWSDPDVALAEAVAAANEAVWQEAVADPRKAGMGTTLVIALVSAGGARIANVGDSRAYGLLGGELRQLSDDHSYVGEAVRDQRMTPAEARAHPYRNVITRVVGTQPHVEPDLVATDLAPGDTILLSTDGLHGPLDDASIAAILAANGLDGAARALIEAANAAGGPDNIAVALAGIV